MRHVVYIPDSSKRGLHLYYVNTNEDGHTWSTEPNRAMQFLNREIAEYTALMRHAQVKDIIDYE